jgi:hypothetical protein
MKDVELLVGDLNDVAYRKLGSPCPAIVVAADSAYRSKARERFQNSRVADVAAVNNQLRLPKHIQRFWSN